MGGIEDDFVRYVIAPRGRRRGRAASTHGAQPAVQRRRGPGRRAPSSMRAAAAAAPPPRSTPTGGGHRRGRTAARRRPTEVGQRPRCGSTRPRVATSPATAAAARSSSSATVADRGRRLPRPNGSRMRDFSDDLAELRRRVADARAYLHVDASRGASSPSSRSRRRSPDLWDDPDARPRGDHARWPGCTRRRRARRRARGAALRRRDAARARARGGRRLRQEPEIEAGIAALAGELDRLELRALFTGEHDERDAICEVHSGAGGTDAQDWTEMLLRMFTRWARAARLRRRARRDAARHRGRASRRRRSP